MGALEAVECPEPRLGGAEAGFCARAPGNDEASPPSRHSQLMSRLATTITIPVMSTAKQEKSRRSLRRKRISSPPPLTSPMHGHLDIPRFGLRLMPDSGIITNYFTLASSEILRLENPAWCSHAVHGELAEPLVRCPSRLPEGPPHHQGSAVSFEPKIVMRFLPVVAGPRFLADRGSGDGVSRRDAGFPPALVASTQEYL